MTEAQAAGLKFKVTPRQPDALLVVDLSRDKDGRLYDSRQGLASYYRYGPRDLSMLCNDNYHDVRAPVKIHHSVFERIKSGATAYAPVGIPESYQVVLDDSSIADQGEGVSESRAQAAERVVQQEGVWNFIWWRRVVYFLTVATSVHLIVFPVLYGTENSREYVTRLRLVPEALRVVGEFLPGFVTTWWIDPFAANPLTFVVSIAVVALSILFGLRLETAIQDRMLAAWGKTVFSENWLTRGLDVVQAFRLTGWYRALLRTVKYKIAPIFFAILTVYLIGAFASHFAFYLEDAAGFTCEPSSNSKALMTSQRTPPLTFEPGTQCWASGVILKRGPIRDQSKSFGRLG